MRTSLLLFILLSTALVEARDYSCGMVMDLSAEVNAYSRSNQIWIPNEADSLSSTLMGLDVPLESAADEFLLIRVEGGTSLWIDEQLVAFANQETSYRWKLDSLSRIYSGESIFLSFYHKSRNWKNFSVKLCTTVPLPEPEPSLIPERRAEGGFNDFFIMALVIILVYYTMLYNRYPEFFREWYSVSKMFGLRPRSDEGLLSSRPVNPVNLTLMIGYGFLLALFVLCYLYVFDPWDSAFSEFNFWSLLFLWAGIAIALVVLLHLRYLFLVLLSDLFELKSFRNIQFIEDFGMWNMFFTVAGIGLAVVFFAWEPGLDTYLRIMVGGFIIFILGRIIILFMKSLSFSDFRKLHLFFYLCTSEILPALIIVKTIQMQGN